MHKLSGRIKSIEVDFAADVDTNIFNQNSFQRIRDNGLHLTDLSLIHYASIHYQSKFGNSLSRRYKYTLDTIEPAIVDSNTARFCFSGDEEPELQKITSEVVGVGFAIALSHTILDIRFNRINRLPINGGRKRCDFEALKGTTRIIIESKGTKNNVPGAVKRIGQQKQEYQNCIKYGVVSYLPRNGELAKLYVVDPRIELDEMNKDYFIMVLLAHYSKAARLAGFYRLSDKINERLVEIRNSNNNTSLFHGRPLDYGNVLKIGKSLSFRIGESEFRSFFSPDMEAGLKAYSKDKALVFGIEQEIAGIIGSQDYEGLLGYSFRNLTDEKFSILDNGTFLIVENRAIILKALG